MENIILSTISIEELRNTIRECVHQTMAEIEFPAQVDNSNQRITISQVCDKFNISKPTLHKHMRLGLEYEKLGRKTLFRTEAVEHYFRLHKKRND